MKIMITSSLLILSSFVGVLAQAGPGDCTEKLLMEAIQANCGNEVKFAGGRIAHYYGEVTDTYIVPVKKGSHEVHMAVYAEGGNCVPATIQVKSECPQ